MNSSFVQVEYIRHGQKYILHATEMAITNWNLRRPGTIMFELLNIKNICTWAATILHGRWKTEGKGSQLMR